MLSVPPGSPQAPAPLCLAREVSSPVPSDGWSGVTRGTSQHHAQLGFCPVPLWSPCVGGEQEQPHHSLGRVVDTGSTHQAHVLGTLLPMTVEASLGAGRKLARVTSPDH